MLTLGACSSGGTSNETNTNTSDTTDAVTIEPGVFDTENSVIYLKADAGVGNGMKETPFGDVAEALACTKALSADGAAPHASLLPGERQYAVHRVHGRLKLRKGRP